MPPLKRSGTHVGGRASQRQRTAALRVLRRMYHPRVFRQQPRARGFVLHGSQRRKPYRASQVPPPEIHQRYTSTPVTWANDPVTPVLPIVRATHVPPPFAVCFKGVDSSRFTGQRLFRKNLTSNFSVRFPDDMDNSGQPRMRVVAGYCKRSKHVALSSTVGTSEFPNGIQLNGSEGQLSSHVDQVIQQTVGRKGVFDPRSAFPAKDFRIIYDKLHDLVNQSIETNPDGSVYRYKKDIDLTFNWQQNKMSTLIPVSTDATVAASAGYQPLNAGEWIPFITIFWVNNSEFDKGSDRPHLNFTDNQYFLDI